MNNAVEQERRMAMLKKARLWQAAIAQTALEAIAQVLVEHGRPASLTLDRDPRLSSERPVDAIFPPPFCASYCAWVSNRRCAPSPARFECVCRVAFPDLPTLPKVPGLVDPDAWLAHVDGQHFVRKIRANGSIQLDDVSYSIKQALAGQYVDISIDASAQQLVIWHQHRPLKRLALKGLYKRLIPFEQFVTMMGKLAHSEQRRQERAKWQTQVEPLLA
jgi:hypothetical protein